jgi:DNA polymerase III delta subunit
MLYFFTWNSDFLIKEQVKAWKDKFISKFWEFNLIHIKDIEWLDNNFIIENVSSRSFLSEKKLIIIDLDEKISEDKQLFIINIIKNIPDENIILFNAVNPDKRTKLYKEIKKASDFKEFNTKNDNDLYSIILNKYWNKITNSWINLLIKYKGWNLNKIISEIEKLLILFDKIDSKEILDNITPELEESIFQLIDDILNKDTINAFKKIDIILNDTNIYAFYNNLIANLRTSIYISKLKNLNKNTTDISSILNLWNRTFLINKYYKIQYWELVRLYTNLINIDKKMKSWNLNWTEEQDFRFELEKTLLIEKS